MPEMPKKETRRLISVDPGIDKVAAAVWEAPVGFRSRQLERVLPLLVRLETVETELDASQPLDGLSDRLASIAEWTFALVRSWEASEVVIEAPATTQVYAGKAARQRTKGAINGDALSKLYSATGAIFGAASAAGAGVRLLKTDSVSKDRWHLLLQSAEKHWGSPLPRKRPHNATRAKWPNGSPRDDEWDAVVIGVRALRGDV